VDCKTNPAISVVIPTYNRAGLIGRSIQSVLDQTYRDFELIVVDDGSTDDTSSVVAAFRDPRINYVRLRRNRGAGAARNAGIRMARGKFLAFQDSDDEWLPTKLAKQMLIFEQASANLGVVYSDKQRVLTDGTITYHASPTVVRGRLVDPATQFYQVYRVGIQSAVMKRESLDVAGYFNEDMPALEDLELFIRLSKRCDFYHIREPLVKYYETDGLSKNLHANWQARKLLLKLYYKELIHDPALFVKECVWLSRIRTGYYLRLRPVHPFLRGLYKAVRHSLPC